MRVRACFPRSPDRETHWPARTGAPTRRDEGPVSLQTTAMLSGQRQRLGTQAASPRCLRLGGRWQPARTMAAPGGAAEPVSVRVSRVSANCPVQSDRMEEVAVAALTGSFDIALGRIEPSDADKENAPAAHDDVRGALAADDTVKAWGLAPILIGSYKRHVSIRRVKDVDVFCRLPELPRSTPPQEVLALFFDLLDTAYGKDTGGKPRVKMQARSVQVSFPEFEGLYVDAVPARQHEDGTTWEIPLKDPEPGKQWQRTNPDRLTALTTAANDETGELYVPTIKLLRQTRRRLLGPKSRPGGLLIEIAAYTAYSKGWLTGENQAEFYASALGGAARVVDEHVRLGADIPDPTLPGHPLRVRATEAQWETARTKLLDAATKANEAAQSDSRCAAAKTFRDLLGGNDDHKFVFDMPDDCNDDGTRKLSAVPLVAGDRHVAAGDRRFG